MATQPTNNAVPSESPRDLKFNAGKIDEFVTSQGWTYADRLGGKHYTIEGINYLAQQVMNAFGYVTLTGVSFTTGATVSNPNEVLFNDANNEYYKWTGSFSSGPKTVPANSTPESTGGIGAGKWLSVGDAQLRSDLSSAKGTDHVGYEGGTLTEKVNSIDVAISESSIAAYARKNSIYLARSNFKISSKQSMTIACIGDSMTAGYDVTSPDKQQPENGDNSTHAAVQYPKALSNALKIITGTTYNVLNLGHSGDTAKMGYARIVSNPNADVAHIMYGINDSVNSSITEYLEYMERFIRKMIDFGSGVVIHTATPQNFGSSNDVAQYYSQSLRALAELYACPIFESATSVQYALKSGVYSDNTHFNSHGYNKYGIAVAAFIVAGGWVMKDKKVNGEIHLQNGRGSEGIGYSVVSATLGLSDSSYLNNQSTGRMSSAGDQIAYSFFQDTEFMDVYAVGTLTGVTCTLSFTLPPQYDGDQRGGLSVNRITLKSAAARGIQETTSFTVSPGRQLQDGNYIHVGCLIGRGWKTVLFSKQSGADSFLNGISIVERRLDEVKQTSAANTGAGSLKPLTEEAIVFQYPYPLLGEDSSNLPTPAKLPSKILLPLPICFFPYETNNNFYYDTLPVEITVIGTASWAKCILFRSGSAPNQMTIGKIASSTDALLPTFARVMKSTYNSIDGSLSGAVEGFGTGTDSQLIELTFGDTDADYYRVIVNSRKKAGFVGVGV